MLEIIFNGKNVGREAVKVLGLAENYKMKREDVKTFLNEDEFGLIKEVLKRNDFSGKNGDFLEVEGRCSKILLMGLGKEVSALSLRENGKKLAKELFRNTEAVVYVSKVKGCKLTESEIAHCLAFGLELGCYSFDKYFTRKKAEEYSSLEKVSFVSEKVIELGDFADYAALANAVRYAKDLGNEPSNYLTPEAFAADLKRLEYLGLEVDVLDQKAMEEEEFKLALAVAKGSVNPPYTVVLKWIGNKEKDNFDVALVGKGITYDSGGVTLKTDAQQLNMKFDMCGAAAVAGAMKAIALQKQPVNAVAVLCLVENMPNGNAYKPDDVFASMSGQTVEIVDTDGEGRLVLADSLCFVQKKFDAERIIDMATLTGTVGAVLAGQFAGLFCDDEKMCRELIETGKSCGEKLWRLPMTEEFDHWINSRIADMKNVGKRAGDGSQAACFLKRFVKEGTKWAHIDIADCELDADFMATGFGVCLLNAYMRGLK
ncbi:MAG: leucyl aminopeptidase [Alphaproteobacteria bacterium]